MGFLVSLCAQFPKLASYVYVYPVTLKLFDRLLFCILVIHPFGIVLALFDGYAPRVVVRVFLGPPPP